MQKYDASRPTVEPIEGPGAWVMRWDRSPELTLIREHFRESERNNIVVLRNLDSNSFMNFSGNLARDKEFKLRQVRDVVYNTREMISSIVSIYAEINNKISLHAAYDILKYTSGAEIYKYANAYRLRTISNFIHRQRRAGAPTTLRQALKRFGASPAYEHAILDQPLNADWSLSKFNSAEFADAFRVDLSLDNEFKNVMKNIIVSANVSRWNLSNITKTISQLEIETNILLNQYQLDIVHDAQYEVDAGVLNININVIGFDEARSALNPIISTIHTQDSNKIVENILEGAARKPGRGLKIFAEGDLIKAIEALSKVAATQIDNAPIEPQPAPLDAYVDGEILRLSGGQSPQSQTPLEQLEALRAEHLQDVDRLLEMLQGANSGPGFNFRMQAVRRQLDQVLTHSSSLLLATNVRALEGMLPAVTESLTDITAADVGAAVSGLGLYIRQFPAWRSFLAEAEDQSEVPEDALAAIRETARALAEQPTNLVEPSLQEGIAEMESAVQSSTDPVLQFGLLRGIGNAYRAIGRYLRERLRGVHQGFTGEFDKRAGQLIAVGTLGGILAIASAALVRLATAYPHEFGWVLGLMSLLSKFIP